MIYFGLHGCSAIIAGLRLDLTFCYKTIHQGTPGGSCKPDLPCLWLLCICTAGTFSAECCLCNGLKVKVKLFWYFIKYRVGQQVKGCRYGSTHS
jgi:hypothetical protein